MGQAVQAVHSRVWSGETLLDRPFVQVGQAGQPIIPMVGMRLSIGGRALAYPHTGIDRTLADFQERA